MIKPVKVLGLLEKIARRRKSVTAIIAAAGSGTRMGLPDGENKIFLSIGEKTVLERTLFIFENTPSVDTIIISARSKDIARVQEITSRFSKPIRIVEGGVTRQESILKAVAVLERTCDFIAIHDCARCLTLVSDVERVINRAFVTGAAAAATKITDTLKISENGVIISEDIDRTYVWSVQTPQVFYKDLYKASVEIAAQKKIRATDDCAIASAAGFKVELVPCSNYNIKITSADDVTLVKKILSGV